MPLQRERLGRLFEPSDPYCRCSRRGPPASLPKLDPYLEGSRKVSSTLASFS